MRAVAVPEVTTAVYHEEHAVHAASYLQSGRWQVAS